MTCISQHTSIFKGLTDKELYNLNLNSTLLSFKRGETVYHQGTKLKGIYCVQQGIVKFLKRGADGREQIIRFARTGDIMGFRSAIVNETACTTTKVIEESVVCFLPSQELFKLIKENGEFALSLLKIACNELGEANDHVTDIAQKTVKTRLAEALLDLKKNFQLDEDNFLKVNLTREELAGIVGTATESVIRHLSELKAEHIIEVNGRRIRLKDIDKLKKMASL
ncbi:MAG: Crp/Fnr family transcriptional regulator [Bacteroidales bacterium]|nr:Crp/Fnr family transcriptional regulator [Bacteroidales bacterium]